MKFSLSRRVLAIMSLAAGLSLVGCASNDKGSSGPQMPRTATKSSSPIKNDLPTLRQGDRSDYDRSEITKINLELATNYFAYRQYDSAEEAVVRALAATPNSTDGLVLLGYIQMEMKDNVRAQAAFDQAIKVAPNDGDVLHNYGTFLCRSGKEAQSIPYFENALKAPGYRRSAVTYAAIGSCQAQLQHDQDASAAFQRALDYDSNLPSALLGVAELALKKGDASTALRNLRKLQRVTPATAESLWLDIRIARALGNRDDERMATSDLKQRFPDSQQTRMLENAGG